METLRVPGAHLELAPVFLVAALRGGGRAARGRPASSHPAPRARRLSRRAPSYDRGMSQRPPIGVLALQGDVREHLRLLTSLGVPAVAVRRPVRAGGGAPGWCCPVASRPR